MRIVIVIVAVVLAGCATPRVLVDKDSCRDAGPELLNCELVKKL